MVRSPEPPPPASDNASIRADAAPTGPPPPPAPRAGTEAAGTAPFEPAAEAPNGEVGEPASPAPPNAAAEGAPSSAAFATGAAPREAEPAEAAPAEAAPAEEAEAVVAVLPPPFAPTLAPRGDGSAPPSPTQAGRACSPVFEVYFQRGSSEPHMRPHVAEVAALRDRLAGNRTAMVLIEGHADAKGPEDYNFKLSEQRARAVADALISAGFDERRLLIDFRGELEPVAGLHPLASLNRRAVVRAGSTAGCRALHAKRSQN